VLPEFVLPSEDLTAALTLRDLLCHRHGLECGPIVHRDAYTGQITDEIYFRLLQDAEIANYVRYSNIHFTLAGRAIEDASGLKWQDFLDQRLFVPAGMMRTTAYASEMYGKLEHAEPMLRIEEMWRRSPLVKTDRTMHAAGGMGTTARDAARWLILNLNGGEIDGRRILPETMEEEYFHGGGYVGAASYISFLPEHGIGVAALANSDGGPQWRRSSPSTSSTGS
jgi:CubicO group peptidase (beta-lactamase class C family)